MKFQLAINIPPLPQPIRHTDRILLVGSCFTEHISGRLAAHKFQTLQNPNGILFNPLSVARSLVSYAAGKQYNESELFYWNELWGSWDHHTRFSHTDKAAALEGINASQKEAADFIRDADHIIITLGSAFQYFLTEEALKQASFSDASLPDTFSRHVTFPLGGKEGMGVYAVANNHRAPAAWFEKHLLEIPAIIEALKDALRIISHINPKAKFLFTISPVRHIRDGVVDNNRSKARLIEAVHALCTSLSNCHYFPAYELVIDVLRDYRFYDIDMVHPNYAATEAVWEAFMQSCIAPEAVPVMQQVKEIVTAKAHRPRFPDTEGHRKFLNAYAEKIAALAAAHPYLNFADEARYFHGGNE
jgi:hypothetical protein